MKKIILVSLFLIFVSLFAFNVSSLQPVWITPIPDAIVVEDSGATNHDLNLSAAPGGDADDPANHALTYSITIQDAAKVACSITVTSNEQLTISQSVADASTSTACVIAEIVATNRRFSIRTLSAPITNSPAVLSYEKVGRRVPRPNPIIRTPCTSTSTASAAESVSACPGIM